jgi:hypothetical protein
MTVIRNTTLINRPIEEEGYSGRPVEVQADDC